MIDGGEEAFNVAVYGIPKGDDSVFQKGYERAKRLIRDKSSTFLQEAKNLYESYNGAEAVSRAKRLLRGLRGIGADDASIYYLAEREICKANVEMRKYVLAQPTLNKLYQTQSCDTWSGDNFKLVNEYKGNPKENPDYLTVMDGVDVDEEEMIIYDGEIELDTLEQFDIISTWQNVENLIQQGIDPTDINQGRL